MEHQRLQEIFFEIIKINALSGNEKPLADFIYSFLNNLNYTIEYDNASQFTSSNTDNIICKVGDGGDFVFTSHMDTARPTEGVRPIVTDEKITSSGDTVLGVDNRAGVAVLLYTLEKITKEKIKVKNFTVAFTTCEETTLFGSKHLGLNNRIKKGFVFDSGYRPGNFIYSACGAIGFKIKIIGKASHSGISPEKGINAILVASKAIAKLPLGRIDDETTMNIGVLKGGSAVNVVPELVELEGEVRSFNLSKAEMYFETIINSFKNESAAVNAKMEYKYFWDFKPYTISSDAEVYKDIHQAIMNVGLQPTPKISLGGSDANSLNENDIQSVNIGIGAQNPHSNEEFILVEDLYKTADIAFELIKQD